MAATRSNPRQARTMGKPDTGSRAKASGAADQAVKRDETADPQEGGVPTNGDGRPLVKLLMTASELIPTGQYANVSVGPAQITAWVDPDRQIEKKEGEAQPYFTAQERETITAALNELAEMVEVDVVAVQRNLVLESLQDTVGSSNGGK